jgi:RNA polymerase sigma-70 factor (ECF subfamily)
MNVTPLLLAGRPTDAVANQHAAGALALNSFRRLLDEIWEESEPPLAKLAVGLGLRGNETADVLQDVYLTALHTPPAIGDRVELRQWLFRVTANRCRRSRWLRLWSSLALAWTTRHPIKNAVVRGELTHEIQRALATLNDDDRKLVVMRYFSDLNSREIADIVGMPEGTVRGRLRTVRRKLADELKDWNDGE